MDPKKRVLTLSLIICHFAFESDHCVLFFLWVVWVLKSLCLCLFQAFLRACFLACMFASLLACLLACSKYLLQAIISIVSDCGCLQSFWRVVFFVELRLCVFEGARVICVSTRANEIAPQT